jgi:hypothetical protein
MTGIIKFILKKKMIQEDKIIDYSITEALVRINQTLVHQHEDSQRKYFRTGKR